MKAMILAAGYGRRLLPLTKETPKPLLKVSNKSLIQRNIGILLDSGFDELVINTAYLGNMIKEHVTKYFPSAKIQFSEEEIPLGTGGGVLKALKLLDTKPFLLVNSDICHEIDINSLRKSTELAHLVGVTNPDHNPDGDFSLEDEVVVIKPGQNDYTWSGISIIHPALFDDIESKESTFDIWNTVLAKHIHNNTVTGEVTNSNWIDIGTVDRLELANNIYKDEN